MTQFYALTPKQAIEVIKAAGVEDSPKLIRDHAAAGLVRTYAQVQVTIDPSGERATVRGGAIAPDAWERMIRDGVDGDVWGGGTVRLSGSDLIGGQSALHITGVAFHPGDVERLADQQRPTPGARRALKRPNMMPEAPVAEAATEPASAPPTKTRRGTDPEPIPPGAILCTIKQAGHALGFGRTKINDMINDGRLETEKIDGAVRIKMASLLALTNKPA